MLEQESRNRRALEAIESIHFRREDWKKLFETYEKLIDVADADAEMADIYARMARISSDALNEEDKAIELLAAACSTSAARNRRRSQALADLTTRREKWEELVEIIERQIAVAPGDHEQIRLYKQLGRDLGGQARPRAQRARCVARRRPDRRQRPRDPALARAAVSLHPGVGRAVSQTIRRIIDVGQHHRRESTRTRRSSCTHSSVSSRATCSAASTKRSMRGAA